MSIGDLLPRKTSGIVEIPEKMMESLAMVLEVIAAGGLESSIPVWEILIPIVGMEVLVSFLRQVLLLPVPNDYSYGRRAVDASY